MVETGPPTTLVTPESNVLGVGRRHSPSQGRGLHTPVPGLGLPGQSPGSQQGFLSKLMTVRCWEGLT